MGERFSVVSEKDINLLVEKAAPENTKKSTSYAVNCSLLGTDNVRGQISVHIFAPNGDYCLYILLMS